MFQIIIDLPDKFKEPLNEIVDNLSIINKKPLTNKEIIEKMIRKYIANEYSILLENAIEDIKKGRKDE